MSISLKQSTTLVIDDFQSMRAMVVSFLKTMGVTGIDSVGTAKEALELLAAKKYDIVICDYNLGHGKNGQQILEEARYKNYISYSTIWIMVTAEKTMDMFMGAAETKPDDYLLKPITEALLETRLKKIKEKKQFFEPVEKAVKQKDYMRAIALCDELLKTPSTSAQEVQRIKSDLLIMMGDFPGAKAYFESILLVRSTPWAKTGLGKVYFMTKEFSQAQEVFQDVLNENKMYLEAADWLAKTYDALGDLAQAQHVLAKAMALSPNASVRQKSLADAAHKNGALDVAQTAYEKAIKLSEHSVHKSSNTFAGLAKVLTAKDEPSEALRVLERTRNEFKNDPDAALQTTIIESMAYQKMGLPEKAEAALAEAEELMKDQPSKVSESAMMDMANTFFKLGKKDKGCELLESVVKNNHENAGMIKMVESVFENAGMVGEGDELIKKSTAEVVNINNQGVILANEGKFEEGIKLLRQALKSLPNNDQMIVNMCGMMIGQMVKKGKDDRIMFEVKEHLDRVRRINPNNKKYNSYMNMLNKLASPPA